MKLLFFIDSLEHPAGTERIAVSTANLLSARGYEISFVVCGRSARSFYPLSDKVTVHVLGVSFGRRLHCAARLRRYIRRFRPDVLVNVAVQMGQVSLPAAFGFGVKILTWEHFSLFAGSKAGYYWRLVSACLSRRTVVLTFRDRQAYPLWLQRRIEVIPNFTDIDIRERSALDKPVLLAVGRLTPLKGYDLLLRVWKSLTDETGGWQLWIVGDGTEKGRLQEIVSELNLAGRVRFIPPTHNIEYYYLQASAFVSSSRSESFGLTLLEAKSFGLPCVAFDCPNGPGMIVRDQTDGILVEDGNEAALADALRRLLSDSTTIRRFGTAGIEDARIRFDRNAVAEQWIKLVGSV